MKKALEKLALLPLFFGLVLTSACNSDNEDDQPQDAVFTFAGRDFVRINLERTMQRLTDLYNRTDGQVLLRPTVENDGSPAWFGFPSLTVDDILGGITQAFAISRDGNIVMAPASIVMPGGAFCDVIEPWRAKGLTIIVQSCERR